MSCPRRYRRAMPKKPEHTVGELRAISEMLRRRSDRLERESAKLTARVANLYRRLAELGIYGTPKR